jgi:V8-like Glu-specific endopeptidase
VTPRFKFALSLSVIGALAAGAWQTAMAQSSITLQTFYAIGLQHAESHPYSFTGRLFIDDDAEVGEGTGTLLRRHTVLTAGHVVFNSTEGFVTNLSFTRALYGNSFVSAQQTNAVDVLGGYQAAVAANPSASTDVETIETAEFDLGYAIVDAAPVDSSWGVYDADPTQLTNNDGRFILGYPGVTFDGLTMAYLVPTAPFVQIGMGTTGAFSNQFYIAEPGFSGGPVYAVVNGQQVVVGELTAGNDDTTGEFNSSLIRAIDIPAAKFFQDAEYNAGLISAVAIKGPATVKRGISHIYHLTVEFAVPNVDGTAATTNRYPELKLKSDTPGTAEVPLTTITKISNTQFVVNFSTQLRPGATVNLTGYFDKNMPAPNSSIAILLK